MIRLLMFASGLGLLAFWYAAQNPNPAPKPPSPAPNGVEIVIDTTVETFPQAPPEAVQSLLKPLEGLFTQYPNDALEMARATKHFATNVRGNPKLTNLSQYSKVEKDGLEGLFKGSLPLQGNYFGKITPTSRVIYNHYLSPFMKDGEGNVITVNLDTASREALADYLDAMSWAFAEQWYKTVTNPVETK